MMEKTTLTVEITYDPEITDPDSLASAVDRLMETVLSTPGLLDEYGNPTIGDFYVQASASACDECGRIIPVSAGGSIVNRHHAQSCSLYDAHNT